MTREEFLTKLGETKGWYIRSGMIRRLLKEGENGGPEQCPVCAVLGAEICKGLSIFGLSFTLVTDAYREKVGPFPKGLEQEIAIAADDKINHAKYSLELREELEKACGLGGAESRREL